MTNPAIELRLPVTSPCCAHALLAYLRVRALPGVEAVDGSTYRRAIELSPQVRGVLAVDLGPVESGHVIASSTVECSPTQLAEIVTRLIDADAPVAQIEGVLKADPDLSRLIEASPGLRIPGTIDPFELTVRAILGQQITVMGARTLAARIASAYGRPLGSTGQITTTFPAPSRLAGAALERLGIPRMRADAIRSVARLALEGESVDTAARWLESPSAESLLDVKGIGPWTASYVALRGFRDRDALPTSDLGLRQVLGAPSAPMSARALAKRASAWRPWRGYAAVHLWTTLLQDASSASAAVVNPARV